MGLHPGMCVAGSNDVAPGYVVVLPAVKAVHYSRGNANRAEHQHHRRGEIFAVALFAFEEEISDWIPWRHRGLLQRVAITRRQVFFDGYGFLVWRVLVSRNLIGQLRDPRIEVVGFLLVNVTDLGIACRL